MPPEPPHNSGYMVAAYMVATIILLGYSYWLYRKVKPRTSATPPR
jgi:hypothetical protein